MEEEREELRRQRAEIVRWLLVIIAILAAALAACFGVHSAK